MKEKLRNFGLQLSIATASVLQMAKPAQAAHNPAHSGAGSAQATGTPTDLFANGGIFQKITNTMIFIVGAIAVLMLIIGGLRYVLSGGNATNVTGAKDTILYAIIGIIVAVLAFAIVNFVLVNIG